MHLDTADGLKVQEASYAGVEKPESEQRRNVTCLNIKMQPLLYSGKHKNGNECSRKLNRSVFLAGYSFDLLVQA